MDDLKTELEVNVVEWDANSPREVAIRINVFDRMFTFSPDSARNLAFMLMECADFIDNGNPVAIADSENEEESLFGPEDEYEVEDTDSDYFGEEDGENEEE